MYKIIDAGRNADGVSSEILFELISFLREKCASNTSVLLLLSQWGAYLHRTDIKLPPQRHDFSTESQYIGVEHYFCDEWKIVMYFSISEINYMLRSGKMRARQRRLSEIAAILHCADASVSQNKPPMLGNNDPYPPIAVFLPAGETTMELIDGNHRVAYAKSINKDISVLELVDFAVPPQAFRDKMSWAAYNILAGAYYFQNPDFEAMYRDIYFRQVWTMLAGL